MRQVSRPAVLPASANAGCMTVGWEFLLPAEVRGVAGAGAAKLVRPPDVAPNDVLINEPNRIALHIAHR